MGHHKNNQRSTHIPKRDEDQPSATWHQHLPAFASSSARKSSSSSLSVISLSIDPSPNLSRRAAPSGSNIYAKDRRLPTQVIVAQTGRFLDLSCTEMRPTSLNCCHMLTSSMLGLWAAG